MSFVVPTIPSINPVTVPALSAKTYSDEWIYSFSLIVPGLSSGNARLELLPYDASTQEILGGVAAEVISFSLWDALSTVTEAQQLVTLLYNSISAFRTFALSGA